MEQRFDLVVSGGVVVTPAASGSRDVAIRDGVIAAIGAPGAFDGTAVEYLDVRGLYVMSGVIDAHVHFRDPGFPDQEDFASGSLAAVMGGVATVLDMPNTDPPTDSVERATEKLARATDAWCDVGLFGLAVDGSIDDLAAMAEADLVVGFKAFLGPTTGHLPAPSDQGLLRAMRVIASLGMRLAVHAEDAAVVARETARLRASGRTDPPAYAESRPVGAEVVAIQRIGALALETGCAVHIVHLSSRDGLEAIERCRKEGADMTCEVSPNHLFLEAEQMSAIGPRMKMNPPVRSGAEGHGEVLLAALADGRIDMVASDHAPHTAAEKLDRDIWAAHAGAVGVETMVPMLLGRAVSTGRLTLERFAEVASSTPARVWGLRGKGRLEIGCDADLTLLDLEREATVDEARLHGRSRLSPFRGERVKGWPVATVVRGRVATRDGRSLGKPGGRAVTSDRSERR